jgi:hypothetical protein
MSHWVSGFITQQTKYKTSLRTMLNCKQWFKIKKMYIAGHIRTGKKWDPNRAPSGEMGNKESWFFAGQHVTIGFGLEKKNFENLLWKACFFIFKHSLLEIIFGAKKIRKVTIFSQKLLFSKWANIGKNFCYFMLI